jgi:hypothetical protein
MLICLASLLIEILSNKVVLPNFNEKSSIVRLIIDSTFALPMIKSWSDLESLHRLSADMYYKLHAQRTWSLQNMPIRDIMNVFILGNDSFLCLYSAEHNSRKWVTSSFSVPQHLHRCTENIATTEEIKLQGQCGNCHAWPHIIT